MYSVEQSGTTIIYAYNSGYRIAVQLYPNKNIHHISYWEVPCPKFKGPEFIAYYPNGNVKKEMYYKINVLHRIDGPAVIAYDEDGTIEFEEFFINGKRIFDPLEFYCLVGEYGRD